MDFGFAAFLEKFEGYFGKTLTRGLVALMGAAVAAASLSLIVHLIVSAGDFVGPEGRARINSLTTSVQLFVLIAGGVIFSTLLNDLRRARRINKELVKKLEETKAEMRRVIDFGKEIEATHETSKREMSELTAAAHMVLEDAIIAALDRDLITPEAAAALRSLRDTGSETQP